MPTSYRPRVLFLPNRVHTERVFSPATLERLMSDFDVTRLVGDSAQDCNSEQVAEAVSGHEAIVTGWGTPVLTEEVFERADALRIIAHSAGTVKRMLLDCARTQVVPRGIRVFSANREIANNTAEHALSLLLMMSRRVLDLALATRRDGWQWPTRMMRPNAQFVMGSTVGVVSASQVGRRIIDLLRPFDTEVLVHDPYLSAAEASALGVEKVELMDVFSRSDMVTVHAPLLPETRGMIHAEHFRALRDGAVFVNTSRGAVLDEEDLIEELERGRIRAALDVTTEEPLAPDSPLLRLDNVVVTPHVAGSGHYGYHRIGESTLRALVDFFAGRAVSGAVDFDRYDIIA